MIFFYGINEENKEFADIWLHLTQPLTEGGNKVLHLRHTATAKEYSIAVEITDTWRQWVSISGTFPDVPPTGQYTLELLDGYTEAGQAMAMLFDGQVTNLTRYEYTPNKIQYEPQYTE